MGVSGLFCVFNTAFMREWQFYSSGFYINFAVFVALSIFINNHNYKLIKSEYEASSNLKRLSYTDRLTGIRNRRGFDESLAASIGTDQAFVLVLIDVDNLKHINDTYGHPSGDDCLTTVADKLTQCLGDEVYRFGGDEFALISQDSAEQICAQLDSINQDMKTEHGEIEIHISAGVYTAGEEASADAVIDSADKALCQAKSIGKPKWVIYQA